MKHSNGVLMKCLVLPVGGKRAIAASQPHWRAQDLHLFPRKIQIAVTMNSTRLLYRDSTLDRANERSVTLSVGGNN